MTTTHMTPTPEIVTGGYEVDDHYWFVGQDRARVFLSKRGQFIPIDDDGYQAWLATRARHATMIDSAASLMGVVWRANTDHPGIADRCAAALGSPRCRRRFKARELVGLITAADLEKIEAAADPAAGLLWARLLVQGEAPVDIKREEVRQGMQLLASLVGADRSQEIVTALGLIFDEGQSEAAER